MHTPSELCAASRLLQADASILHVGSVKATRMRCSLSKHHIQYSFLFLHLSQQVSAYVQLVSDNAKICIQACALLKQIFITTLWRPGCLIAQSQRWPS